MGQIASNLGNSNVTDPRQARPQDLSGSEMGARMIAQGTRGLANGFQNYQQQNQQLRGGGGGMMQMPQAQPVSPDYFTQPQQNQNLIKRAGGMSGNNLAFYGQGQ